MFTNERIKRSRSLIETTHVGVCARAHTHTHTSLLAHTPALAPLAHCGLVKFRMLVSAVFSLDLWRKDIFVLSGMTRKLAQCIGPHAARMPSVKVHARNTDTNMGVRLAENEGAKERERAHAKERN